MTERAKEFAELWADENMPSTERLTDEEVSAKVQMMMSAATGVGVSPIDISEAVGSPFDFLKARTARAV